MQLKTKLTKNGYLEVDVTPEIYEKAKEMALENSFDSQVRLENKEKAMLVGMLGELIYKLYNPDSIHANTYNYDFIYNEQTIDVKTFSGYDEPKPSHYVSLFSYNMQKQRCDKYVFIKYSDKHKKAWIIGEITKQDYKNKSTFHKADEAINDFITYKKDGYHLAIENIESIGVAA